METSQERPRFTKDGQEIVEEWWNQKYTMESRFCGYKDDKAIEVLTLDELLDMIKKQTGIEYFPLVSKKEVEA